MKTVEEWRRHYDSKAEAIVNPIELVDFCVDGVPLDAEFHRRVIIEPVLERLELKSHHHFLEIGCGSGLILGAAEELVSRSVGTDISERLLRNYQGKSETIVCAADELPFQECEYDRILMFSVAIQFPSFDYFKDVVGKVIPLLRKDGLFLIGDLLFGSEHPGSQYFYYDKHQMIDYLDALGLPYSLMAQAARKREVNTRHDVLIYT